MKTYQDAKNLVQRLAGGNYRGAFWSTVIIGMGCAILFNAGGTYFGLNHTPWLLSLIGGSQNVSSVVIGFTSMEALAIVIALMPKQSFDRGIHLPLFKLYMVGGVIQAWIVAMAEWENGLLLPNNDLVHLILAIVIAITLYIIRVLCMWVFVVAGKFAVEFDF